MQCVLVCVCMLCLYVQCLCASVQGHRMCRYFQNSTSRFFLFTYIRKKSTHYSSIPELQYPRFHDTPHTWERMWIFCERHTHTSIRAECTTRIPQKNNREPHIRSFFLYHLILRFSMSVQPYYHSSGHPYRPFFVVYFADT